MIRIALAAPSAMLLAGLESLLSGDAHHVVVERASRLETLAESLEGAEVDVVVAVVEGAVRFRLPGSDDEDGVGGARIPVVILADTETAASSAEWLRRGARAVLPRDAEPREIHAAIDAVAAGLVVLAAVDANAMAGAGTTDRSTSRLTGRGAPSLALSPLSPREREILGLMAEGLVNKLIAVRLGISEHTVKTHVASIFSKLDVETRAEAVAVGVRTGAILL